MFTNCEMWPAALFPPALETVVAGVIFAALAGGAFGFFAVPGLMISVLSPDSRITIALVCGGAILLMWAATRHRPSLRPVMWLAVLPGFAAGALILANSEVF